MSATVEDDHLIFTQKFFSSDYFFAFSGANNSVSGLIQTTTYSADIPVDYMPDEDLVDTMVNDMLEAMELKSGEICDDYDSSCGRKHKMYEDTYSLSDAHETIQEIIDIWISEPINVARYIVKGNIIVYLSENR